MTLPRSNPRPQLRGDQNQCPTCLALFNSTAAFDKHRTGRFGDPSHPRRCLAEAEMLGAGMARNERGFWVTMLMGEAARRRRYADTSPAAIAAESPSSTAGNGIREGL